MSKEKSSVILEKLSNNEERTFTGYRKHIYASINGTKGNLIRLSKSKLLSKVEKEKLDKVIDALEDLSVEFYNNRGSNNRGSKSLKHIAIFEPLITKQACINFFLDVMKDVQYNKNGCHLFSSKMDAEKSLKLFNDMRCFWIEKEDGKFIIYETKMEM